ncbi:hypothetical protein 019DV002_56 [Bacillus phage 019DV002]|uniref:Uncharacterized protein n=1 Tax=Bacillus phage 019DV002 TaxID=2601653 RepID=A0A5J6T5A2_9CAUD|nr:hypothetical protein 019DV002_56 [Bacillus phage 019DV002]QFG05283.1 hypothetical protein 019DV004_56 [Bacillus phage 019DV004]
MRTENNYKTLTSWEWMRATNALKEELLDTIAPTHIWQKSEDLIELRGGAINAQFDRISYTLSVRHTSSPKKGRAISISDLKIAEDALISWSKKLEKGEYNNEYQPTRVSRSTAS